MGREYSSLDVTILTGASLRQLQWWDERGLVSPTQRGHRRLYNVFEILQVSLVMGLRKKGMSLQRIRKVMLCVTETAGDYYFDLHRRGSDVFLLTDGDRVFVETSKDRITEIVMDSALPISGLCISDLIRQLDPSQAAGLKPVQRETHSTGPRRIAKAS